MKDEKIMANHLPPCYGIIPARYASSRFPGKPLADILGRPMFWHVYDRARRCPELKEVILATDDERIRDKARELDVPVIMTRPAHASGTDRIHEAAAALGISDESVVVNIQGDEPALDPTMVSGLVAPFADASVRVTTLVHQIDAARAQSPDQVKAALTKHGVALYFSRSPIPYPGTEDDKFWGHIGMYGFRKAVLDRFVSLGPSPLELRERLEQLRLLEDGIPIHVVPTTHPTRGVDRPEDIEYVIKILTESMHEGDTGA